MLRARRNATACWPPLHSAASRWQTFTTRASAWSAFPTATSPRRKTLPTASSMSPGRGRKISSIADSRSNSRSHRPNAWANSLADRSCFWTTPTTARRARPRTRCTCCARRCASASPVSRWRLSAILKPSRKLSRPAKARGSPCRWAARWTCPRSGARASP